MISNHFLRPEKHYSRKRDDNLRLSAPRLGNGNASISAALALRRSTSLAVACLSARKWTNEFVRFARLCRSKTKTGSVSLPKGREDSRKGIFFKILVDTFVVHSDIVYVEWLR